MDATKKRKRKRKRKRKQLSGLITDDLLVQILARLPTKSFVRFKCVCKSWLRLASDPHYRKHLPAVPGPMSGVFYNSGEPKVARYHTILTDGVTDGTLSFLPSVGQAIIVDCCNGLLLCRSEGSDPVTSYYVCNPATRKWAHVPFGSGQLLHLPRLAFDPRLSSHYYILNIQKDPNKDYELEIFSSKTGEWMETRIPLGSIVRLRRSFFTWVPYFTSGAYFNGSYHVFSDGNRISRIGICSQKFTVDTREFMLPNLQEGATSYKGRLGKSGGYLYFAWYQKFAARNEARMSVWVLQGYENHVWVLRHSVDIKAAIVNHRDPEISSSSSKFPTKFELMAFHPDTEVVFLRLDKKILSYNWKSGTLTRVFNINFVPTRFPKWFFEYSPYLIESFDL